MHGRKTDPAATPHRQLALQPSTGEAGYIRDAQHGKRTRITSIAVAAAPGPVPGPARSRTAAWRR